jgi:hypothetical protein
MIVHNLASDMIATFGADMSPEWALALCYCSEHNRLSALFAARDSDNLDAFMMSLPFFYGVYSISLGDYCARVD